MVEGTVLRFRCRLLSPFHTTRQEYASLWKSAPFIPGSTLRGAVLSFLIGAHCSTNRVDQLKVLRDPGEIRRFHLRCEADCPVRPFFADPSPVRFSFGHFEELRFQRQTRVALTREGGSVALGAFLQVEAIEAGTPFAFEVILLEGGPVPEVVEAGVAGAAHTGIGGLRSVGMGRFEVQGVERKSLSDHLREIRGRFPQVEGAVTLTFTTPYVLSTGSEVWDGDPQAMARRVERELTEVAEVARETVNIPPLQRLDMVLRPDFMGRWSYETGRWEHRLVAWPGSTMTLLSDSWEDLRTALELAQAFGLGEGAEWGCGRFEAEDAGNLP